MSVGEPATIFASGPGHAIWLAPGVFGTSFWGPHVPGTHDTFFDDVDRAMALVAPPFDYFADSHRTRLGDHDWISVRRGVAWMRKRRERLEALTRQAIIVAPNNVFGWAVAGSHRLVGMRYPSRVASTIPEAVAWLTHPQPGLASWLDHLPDRVRAASSELARLRRVLAEAPDTNIGDAAQHLGLSRRNLQRLLQAHGTTFRRERARQQQR